ncbi:MAG: type IV secretory system conjugative DNA transfer family protein [Clostridia bacterium]|nr:type IV secretory system conjugative DNA transfer family protein [Clostridia bacterium]
MEYKLGKYQNLNQETRWATMEEIERSSTHINLYNDKYPGAGIPIISDGHEAYVDSKDTHTLIFGATGSKKTRLFCMPTINFFIKAGESFVATDPKGELYDRTAGLAKANGYKTVVINFREIGKGDMWNPLSIPYELYNSGKKDEAVALLNDFVRMIASPQLESTNDAFWPEMASSLALANLLLLMEAATPEEANVASLATLCTNASSKRLSDLCKNMRTDTIAGVNYKSVFTSPERTLQSILAVLFGMVRIFITQRNLNNMLSGSTIDISRFGREKTAVYLIIPDEKSTYHFLVTTFIKQAYEMLISEAQKEKNRMLPVRVNFVLDEFCNLPKIPDMPSMISAARSRNMRYFLVAQSLHQLKGRYGEDADTIKGNCENWVFLTSKELDLLNEISDLCGSYHTANGTERKLISVSELQRLDKEKGEALIMHARQYPIITEVADIDSYSMFKGYPAAPLCEYEMPEAKVFDLEIFYKEVISEIRPLPFS